VLVHFANNAVAIVIGTYAARSPDMNLEDLDSVHIPWYFLVTGFLFLAVSVYAMNRVAQGRISQVDSERTNYVATEVTSDEREES
jgi:hypothetical protein